MKCYAPFAAAFTIAAATSAFAQDPATTQGLAGPAPVTIIDGAHRSGFEAFVARENRPSVQFGQDVRIGTVLPEKTITFYAVPADYGARGYRYAVLNNHVVLVHPTTHAIIEVVH
jgi:hypothetical protein